MSRLPILSLTTYAALTLSTALVADDESRLRNIENRITAMEDSQNGCCVLNPPARPFNACDWGIYLKVDPFVWQAHASGIAPAIETSSSPLFFNSDGKSQVKNFNFDWDWGFRLGLGCNLPHDGWDTLLQWTYWKTSASKTIPVPATGALFPRLGHPGVVFIQSATGLEGKWDLKLDFLDLENGRAFYVSRFFSLRPFAGLRSAWLNQHLNTTYDGIGIGSAPALAVNQSNRYWGLGIRGGLDMQWGFSSNWSLFSNYSSSLLYNYFSVKHKETELGANGAEVEQFDVVNFYHLGTSITDMQIGVRFDWSSCDECFHLGLDLGWEHHYFPGQEKFLLFVDFNTRGSYVDDLGALATQGYFLKVRFDF